MGKERKLYKVLVGKPEGRRLFGRPRRRWEDVIRMGSCDYDDEPSGSSATELVLDQIFFIVTILKLRIFFP
jgi:hypothetical protein